MSSRPALGRLCSQSVIQHQRPARVGDVVLQEGGPHGHAHLVPAVAFVVDGLDGAGRPAGEVPVERGQEVAVGPWAWPPQAQAVLGQPNPFSSFPFLRRAFPGSNC